MTLFHLLGFRKKSKKMNKCKKVLKRARALSDLKAELSGVSNPVTRVSDGMGGRLNLIL